MEVPAPFSKRKRRHNPASLNRRESYIHKKMNASDFFDFCLKEICLTLVKVGAYRKLDILGQECINFLYIGMVSEKNLHSTSGSSNSGRSLWKLSVNLSLLIEAAFCSYLARALTNPGKCYSRPD
jgi:hypothetical protein